MMGILALIAPKEMPMFKVCPGVRSCASVTAAALFVLAGCASESGSGVQSVAKVLASSEAKSEGSPPKPSEDTFTKPGSYAVIDGKKTEIPKIPMGDPATVKRIVDEGKNRNQVMDHLTYLTQQIGPRLTGSSNAEKANLWGKQLFEKWGLTNTQLYKWGEIAVRFDRGPSTGRIVAARDPNAENPEYRTVRDMEFTTLAWGAGTNGPVRGRVLKMPETEAQFEAVKDQIHGSWLLIKANQPGRRGVGGFAGGVNARQRVFADLRKKWKNPEAAEAKADTKPEPAPDPDLTKFEGLATGGPVGPDGTPVIVEVNLKDPSKVTGNFGFPGYRLGAMKDATFNAETHELKFRWEGPGGESDYMLTIEGDSIKGQRTLGDGSVISYAGKKVAADKAKPADEKPKGPSIEERVLQAGPAGFISSSSDELVRTSSITGWRRLDYDNLPQDVEVTVRQSDYDYMNSRLADGQRVEAEFDCKNAFVKGPVPVYDTIAEIKGTTWPDEVVIISAHTDSWNGPGSQGCTDNGTGTVVTLEAARILAAAKAKPKRTIRFILWTGEEQGLLGSQAYVQSLSQDDLAKISAVFVDDGGTNYEGGLNAIDSMVPYLAAATAPVNGVFYSDVDKKFMDVNIKHQKIFFQEAASDNASFNLAQVPGFFWDEVGRAKYNFGWHTQNDKLDLAIPEYLVQSSTNAAVTAYNLACAPRLLPRATDKSAADEKAPETPTRQNGQDPGRQAPAGK